MRLIDLCLYTKHQSDNDVGIYESFRTAEDILTASKILEELK